MSVDQHINEAAKAVRRQARRAIAHDVAPPRYALVRLADPLTVELLDSQHVLDGEDLVLGQWARRYEKEYGIDEGDRVVLIPMGDGDWLVSDVISEKDL